MGDNRDKREFFKIMGVEGKRGSWNFAKKFHTRYEEESEGDRGETSMSKGGETGEGELQVGENGGMGEDNGEDTGLYLEEEGNLSSDIEEEICEGEEIE